MNLTELKSPKSRRRHAKLRRKRRKSGNTTPGQSQQPLINSFRAQHLALAQRQIITELGRTSVIVDETESPLVWLSRRRGRDGRALIEPHQLQAGERLRVDFTQAHLMPRTTSNWSTPLASDRRGNSGERAGQSTEIPSVRSSPACCSIFAASSKGLKMSSANEPGRRARAKS